MFTQTTQELISLLPYAERRSWYATLMAIRSYEETPERDANLEV